MFYDPISWLTTGLRRNPGSQHHLTTEVLEKGRDLCTVCMCIFGIFILFFRYSGFSSIPRGETVLLSTFMGGFPSNSKMCLHLLYTYSLYLILLFLCNMGYVLYLCSNYAYTKVFLHSCNIHQNCTETTTRDDVSLMNIFHVYSSILIF